MKTLLLLAVGVSVPYMSLAIVQAAGIGRDVYRAADFWFELSRRIDGPAARFCESYGRYTCK
jgi:hypothetical protein